MRCRKHSYRFVTERSSKVTLYIVFHLSFRYTILLKHYLESQFSYVFAADYLAALLDSIVEGKMVAVEMTAMFNGWKSTLDPLMVEVMNLT